jgi:hypothetical protein
MRESLIVVGLVVLAIGLRSSRSPTPRKLGALTFLVAGFLLFAFLTDCWWCGMFGVIPWFLLPWVELLTRVRRMRLPLENRLAHGCTPDPAFFPNAPESARGMEEAGFEHIDDCGWKWSGMRQHFRIFWHPEECAEATVCLCEQGEVAFAFISVTSRDESGNIYRTTNYPFSPTLRCPPRVRWNHVPCERNVFGEILEDHRKFLRHLKVSHDSLRMPDPERIESMIEEEMKEQIAHNLGSGIIEPSDERHFKYSWRGMMFLWGQFVKDMIRLC